MTPPTPPTGPNPLLALSAADLAAAVNSGEVSAVEVVSAALARIEAHRDGHAFVTVCGAEAMDRARTNPKGPLAGVPLGVKDLFDTTGIRTTAGSAIVVGKANMHEFAWGTTSRNPHFGTVANPRLPGRVAGGSSGGTAAALADYQATIGLGTDTGGSIRIPSALERPKPCGRSPSLG